VATLEASDKRLLRRRYLSIVVFLLLLLLLTYGLRTWRIASLGNNATEQQSREVAEAVEVIERRFAALQAEMLEEARRWAAAPEVVSSLRGLEERLVSSEMERIVSYAANLNLPARAAVEFYNRESFLVAWQGFSMPPDDTPQQAGFLNSLQTVIVKDGEYRQALAVWWPVQDADGIVGAIRVLRLVDVRTPVQNRYLRSYSLAAEWQTATGLPVQVYWGDVPANAPAQGRHVLQGADGGVLGYAVVQPPSVEDLEWLAGGRYNDVLAFWLTMLLFWLMAGLWLWYRSAVPVSSVERMGRTGTGRLAFRFVLLGAGWWAVRFALLHGNVPARWQSQKAPLAPLFDPSHLASAVGDGLFRSSGDLLITSVFAAVFAAVLLDFVAILRRPGREALLRDTVRKEQAQKSLLLRFAGLAVLSTLIVTGLAYGLAFVSHRMILDSTIDYFARTGLVPEQPERLILVVFCALLLLTLATVLVILAALWPVVPASMALRRSRWPLVMVAALYAGAVAILFTLLYTLTPIGDVLPWPVALLFLVAGITLVLAGRFRQTGVLELLTLRGLLLAVFLTGMLLYPIFYGGMDARRRMQMVDSSESFGERQDPRVLFAIEQVLEQARSGRGSVRLLELLSGRTAPDILRPQLDSLSGELLRNSFLFSLGSYDVSVSILDTQGNLLGRYYEADRVPAASAALDQMDATEFEIIQAMYAEQGSSGMMIEQITGRLQRDRFQYIGIVPITDEESGRRVGWVMSRVESQTLLQYNETPFPRVLLPSGYLGNMRQNLSLANFQNGVLVRSLGRDFGRYALDEQVQVALLTTPELWNVESVEGRRYLTYYRREEAVSALSGLNEQAPRSGLSVVAARMPAMNAFDHLYYLLRLTVGGLFIALPVYLIGLYVRWRKGIFPPTRIHFRDKVLNAFLSVGIISVATVGVVGQDVVTEETESAVRFNLRQHFERVESILALQGEGSEMPYRVLSRTHIDSLASVAGLDLNLYRQGRLEETTRPQFVRDRLIDQRLPIEAYQALYLEGYRTTFIEEQIGSFTYVAGYHALLDEAGQPYYVISVPTLPEQERLEEERARTVAYLFGALLLLMLAVMFTASLISGALTRPIGRLRTGLKAVAKGQFERAIPVTSRDEIGDLVHTFNEMQEQLADSRRKVAQHERQLAWREMARQVAHEIKNPLTPMKLSVQHLRRAFEDSKMGDAGAGASGTSRFANVFDRITVTLIEQIDTLARIANEFHTFARMPTRMLERLDLNTVVREAVSLMQEESPAEITLDLYGEPLSVEADREELRRIYINLIKNAIQAIPEEREGRVVVSTKLSGSTNGSADWAVSTIADNGVGIPQELRDKIFEPNFSTKTSGTGLGLAITRKSIEEMQGEIGFETEEGTGTVFRIRLPLAEE
jgi:two-component system, NtrC family, nitrogen regulation sensor histidine kinase NtrY